MLITSTAGPALPDLMLIYKNEYIAMILRNLDRNRCLVNVTHYIVENLSNIVLLFLFVNEKTVWKRFILPRIPCGPGDEILAIYGFSRTQFPIMYFFGITINNSQR